MAEEQDISNPSETNEESATPSDKTAKSKDESPADTDETTKPKKGILGRLRRNNQPTTDAKGQSPEEIAEQLYKHIAEARGIDYFVFRIRKRTILVLMGLVIILMWVFLSWQWWQRGLMSDSEETAPEPPAEITTTPTASEQKDLSIRIRNASAGSEEVEDLATLLTQAGYETEVVDDAEADIDSISVVVRPDATDLRLELETLLEGQYVLSSPSAELTTDSDFDAVILFHENGVLP